MSANCSNITAHVQQLCVDKNEELNNTVARSKVSWTGIKNVFGKLKSNTSALGNNIDEAWLVIKLFYTKLSRWRSWIVLAATTQVICKDKGLSRTDAQVGFRP